MTREAALTQPNDTPASRLLGTWQLVSVIREEVPSGLTIDLMGPNPQGFITYSADGRMVVIIVRGDRHKPAATTATATEAENLFRSVISYAGTYTIAGNEVTHHVDISWNETWTGTQQVRIFKLEGHRLSLSTPVSPDPLDGKVSIRSLVWEKLK
ncbi:Lipocalin-like domain containing protein [Burkholderiaceae bacterium]